MILHNHIDLPTHCLLICSLIPSVPDADSSANPILLGPVQHDCTLNPILDAPYMNIMKQRKLEAEHARRPVIRMEDVETNKGKLNQMSGGWSNVTSKMGGSMVVSCLLIFGSRIWTGERLL